MTTTEYKIVTRQMLVQTQPPSRVLRWIFPFVVAALLGGLFALGAGSLIYAGDEAAAPTTEQHGLLQTPP
jgi:hypothetical protein